MDQLCFKKYWSIWYFQIEAEYTNIGKSDLARFSQPSTTFNHFPILPLFPHIFELCNNSTLFQAVEDIASFVKAMNAKYSLKRIGAGPVMTSIHSFLVELRQTSAWTLKKRTDLESMVTWTWILKAWLEQTQVGMDQYLLIPFLVGYSHPF